MCDWPEFVLVDQWEQAPQLIICSTKNGSNLDLSKTIHQSLDIWKFFLVGRKNGKGFMYLFS